MKPVRFGKVPFVLLVPDLAGDERAGELLRLAAPRGWLCWPQAFSLGAKRQRQARPPLGMFLPASWRAERASADGCRVSFYESTLDLSAVGLPEAGADSWVGIRNGRYAVEVNEAVLEEALASEEAEVLAVTLEPKHRAYREKLRVGADGAVLGFRRLYRDEVVPAALPQHWPPLLLVRQGALEPFAGGRSVPSCFASLVSQWRERGVRVRALAAGGLTWDLGSATGLLAFFQRAAEGRPGGQAMDGGRGVSIAPRARLHGTVIVEGGVRIGEDAVILGPSFLGRDARVGRGALVHRSILAPGTEVAEGEVLSDQVVSRRFREAVRLETAAEAEAEPAAGAVFRHWPWFSFARLGKRLMDIAGSLVALSLSALIFPLLAVAIKLNSKGPVFYVHRRQGRYGKEFGCIKFRTMVTEAHHLQEEMRAMSDVDGPQFKVRDDPRVTLVGAFLRQTNLDEMPQFINVLLGQMSMVGPRPSPDTENQMCPAWREARLSVRPGITGLWQVSRSKERSNDFQEWIYYDTEYVRNLSLWRDLVIMAKTVKILLRGFARLFVSGRPEEPADEPSAADGLPLTGRQGGGGGPRGSGGTPDRKAAACSPVATAPEQDRGSTSALMRKGDS